MDIVSKLRTHRILENNYIQIVKIVYLHVHECLRHETVVTERQSTKQSPENKYVIAFSYMADEIRILYIELRCGINF